MSEEREKGDRGSGFTVVDRRGEAKEDPVPQGPASGQASAPSQAAASCGPPPAPINFITFLLSLSSSALIQLGEIPDPFTQQTGTNLQAAQQTIDILGLLEEKTKGNLDDEEARTLEAILFDLRMRFLKASGRL